MSTITLYHNPHCSTSRQVLQALRDGGAEPTVIAYLEQPPDQATLTALLAAMDMPARDLLRSKEAQYAALGLDNPGLSEAQLIAAMAQHPILINRPIVVTPKGTLLVRPKERLAEVFP